MITYKLSTCVFIRGIGILYSIAFISLWSQCDGLFLQNGIYPIQEYLKEILVYKEQNLENFHTWQLAPSVFWFEDSDTMVQVVLLLGLISSVFLIIGITPKISAILSWVSYLSFCTGAPVFLNFQWDNLLLEAGFLTIFVCPTTLFYKNKNPSTIWRWLLYFLVFRLLIESSILKLVSSDAYGINNWKNFTALNYHFFTQPIPHIGSWYAHHLPEWIKKVSIFMMFIIQGILPFFQFTTPFLKKVAFFGITTFMILILLTGNYGFFNLTTIILCFPLIDDPFIEKFYLFFKRKNKNQIKNYDKSDPFKKNRFTSQVVLFIFAGFLIFKSSFDFFDCVGLPIQKPNWFFKIDNFRIINSYGLFRVVTTERPEILIEGSKDGKKWEKFYFKYKTSSEKEISNFLFPHMPRLDWQMWFAAIQYQSSKQLPHWFIRFTNKISIGEQDVLNLLEKYPEPIDKIKYLRITLEKFTFSDSFDKSHLRWWWRKNKLHEYTIHMKLNN